MITTPFTFNWFEDALVVILDLITLALVVQRIWAYRHLEGGLLLYVRAAFGVVVVAMCYQIASSIGRLTGNPLDSDFQSGWALKDFGLFMYVTAFALIQRAVSKATPPEYHVSPRRVVANIREEIAHPRREQ